MGRVSYPFSERVLRDMSSAVLVLDSKGRIAYVNGPAGGRRGLPGGKSPIPDDYGQPGKRQLS